MTDESPKKPLPFSNAVPTTMPVDQSPERVRDHLLELVAYAVREGSEVVNFNVPNVSHPDGKGGTLDLGDWKITVARVS